MSQLNAEKKVNPFEQKSATSASDSAKKVVTFNVIHIYEGRVQISRRLNFNSGAIAGRSLNVFLLSIMEVACVSAHPTFKVYAPLI